MSFTVDEAFVTQFADDFYMVGQQKKSRLESYVTNRGKIVGEAFTVDILGKGSGSEIMSRHGDTPLNDTTVSRRFADMRDFDHAELIDQLDEVKMLIQPKNRYVQNSISVLNRYKDQVIVDALLGSARTKSGSTALPSGQKIAVGGTALTLDKLRQTKVLLDEAEMDDSDFFDSIGHQPGYQSEFGQGMASYIIIVSTKQLDAMLAVTEVKSADYNSVKALVNGAIDTYMGFKFVRVPTDRLPLSGGTRSCVAYAPRALHFGTGKEIGARLAERPDKRFSWQVYANASFGAVRAEDAGVVQIDCTES